MRPSNVAPATGSRLAIQALLVLALIAGFAPLSAAQSLVDKGHAAALRKKARDAGSIRVIVQVRDGPGVRALTAPGAPSAVASALEELAARKARLLERVAPGERKGVKSFEHLPLVALEVTSRGLDELLAAPESAWIAEDVALPPTLAESVPLIGGPAAFAAGFSGQGQAVAILDTGVDADHPFLAGAVVHGACFSTTSQLSGSTTLCPEGTTMQLGPAAAAPCPEEVSGCSHGTHVAGIAAGVNASMSGVAPEADIIAIQVFSRFESESSCDPRPAPCVKSFTSDQIRALDYLFSLRGDFDIASANMSLGGGEFAAPCDGSPTKQAIDLLRSVGIATVIASGNDGFADAISSPACISSSVSVGSTTKLDAVSSFSNIAPFLVLLAPGSSIRSSVPGGGFAYFSGTSMAAPHVAGAMAVLKSRVPEASVDQMVAALTGTGIPVMDTESGLVLPRIQIDTALDALQAIRSGASLAVSPSASLAASGQEGGPFNPDSRQYTLKNIGSVALEFSVAASPSWIDVSLSEGLLDPDAEVSIEVSLDAAVSTFAPGTHVGSVNFENLTGGGSTSRAVSVAVLEAISNDKFDEAIILSTTDGSTTGTNVGATREPGEPDHADGAGEASVWWRWVAPSRGTLTIDTLGSDFDTVLGAYTGTGVSTLTSVAQNDDAIGQQSRVSFSTETGETYHIAVDGFSGATGSIGLNWSFVEDQSGVGSLAVTPTTGLAASGPVGGPFAPSSKTYTLTNTGTSQVSFSVTVSGDFVDASLSQGTLAPGEEETLEVSINSRANSLLTGVHGGAVDISGIGRSVVVTVGSQVLSNDDFVDRTFLSGSQLDVSGTNVDASKEPGEPDHAGNSGGRSVWWSWVAPSSGTTRIDTGGSSFDTILGVYVGDQVDALAEIASDDDSGPGLQSSVDFFATAGQSYEIAVDGYSGRSGGVSLSIAVGIPDVRGDDFADRVGLVGSSVSASGSNVGATREVGEPDHADGLAERSVWWTWQAPRSGTVSVDTFGSNFDTLLGVYEGASVDQLAEVTSNDDAPGVLTLQSAVSFQAEAGTSYEIAVDGYLGDSGDIQLTLIPEASALWQQVLALLGLVALRRASRLRTRSSGA